MNPMSQMQPMDFINNGTGRPRPKAGYRCKICGKEGGLQDSHWYQLCPFKGDKRTFNPPRKGYMCKFCHKQGGEPDSHWFQQCPKRHEFEGIQVPHPLKLRAGAGMMGMLPQTMTAHSAALAMNLGVMPDSGYQQQFATNGMGFLMYPNQLNPMQQINQQQLYFLQQQMGQSASQSQQPPNAEFGHEFDINERHGLYDNRDRVPQRFGMHFDERKKQSHEEDGSHLLNELTKKTQELNFDENAGDNSAANEEAN